jgi:leucyl aminopeptidase
MNFQLTSDPIEAVEAHAAVIVLFEPNGDGKPGGRFTDPTAGLITELYERKEFIGKFLSTTLIHRPEGFRAGRLLLVGGGKESEFNLSRLRQAAGAAIRRLRGVDKPAVALDPPGKYSAAAEAQVMVEGAILADYRVDNYKTIEPDRAAIGKILLCADSGVESSVERGRAVAESQNFSRGLVNEPGNILTPIELAARASTMAQECGLEIDVLYQDRMAALNMNALLGVAQGSDNPPTLMVVKYRPEGAVKAPHLGLVGKAVTFDTGGISIKPAKDMDQMKHDMAGGASMLGAIRALSQLKPGIAVTAIVPSVENMPSARAQRPGDVVTTMSGKTVEVLNTDAEGRLILADALTYAQQQGCTHLVDAATLTGSIVVALGNLRAGAFSNNQEWQSKLLASADLSGEKMWAMPLDEEYNEQLNSPIADIPNIGSRSGGSITAAMFLKQFADPLPWVHLDIAGMAWLEETRPDLPKGPSGIGVRTLIDLAMRMGS